MIFLYFMIINNVMFFNVTSLEYIQYRTLDNIYSQQIYDFKLTQNGTKAFVSLKINSFVQSFIKVNLKQTIPYKINDYPQISQKYPISKKKILFFPQWQILTLYSPLTRNHSVYNSTSNTYKYSFLSSPKNAIHSTIYNRVVFLNSINQPAYQSLDQFIAGQNGINIISKKNQTFQILQFSKNQTLLCITQLVLLNTSFRSIIQIYNVSLAGFKSFKIKVSNFNDRFINSISWKNDNVIYFVTKSIYSSNQLCIYTLSNDTIICKQYFEEIFAVKYSYIYDRVLFYRVNKLSKTFYSVFFQFLYPDNLTTQKSYFHTITFQPIQVQIQDFNQANKTVIIQKGHSKINLRLIVQDCPTGFYFDTCKYDCRQFHSGCFNNSRQGCDCLNKDQSILNQINELIKNSQTISGTVDNNVIGGSSKMPGIRGAIKPLGSFLMSFGELFLYNYHDRRYNQVVAAFFDAINNLQQSKWNVFDLNEVIKSLAPNFTRIQHSLSIKKKFTTPKFMQIQNKSLDFYLNTMSFIFPNIVITFLTFILFRTIFYVLIKHQVSRIFRMFSFWPYFFIVLFEGNYQYFSYLYAFELKFFFQMNFLHKLSSISLVIFFAFLLVFTVSSYFLFRYLYNDIAYYFFENVGINNLGSFHLVTYKGTRQILLGMTHMIISKEFGFGKIFMLSMIEIIFLCEYVFIIRHKNVLRVKLTGWIDIFSALTRILLLFSFNFPQEIITLQALAALMTCQISFLLIYVYVSIQIFGIFIKIMNITLRFIALIANKFKGILKWFQMGKYKKIIKVQVLRQKKKYQIDQTFKIFKFIPNQQYIQKSNILANVNNKKAQAQKKQRKQQMKNLLKQNKIFRRNKYQTQKFNNSQKKWLKIILKSKTCDECSITNIKKQQQQMKPLFDLLFMGKKKQNNLQTKNVSSKFHLIFFCQDLLQTVIQIQQVIFKK